MLAQSNLQIVALETCISWQDLFAINSCPLRREATQHFFISVSSQHCQVSLVAVAHTKYRRGWCNRPYPVSIHSVIVLALILPPCVRALFRSARGTSTDSGSSDDNSGIVIGLSLALGLTLVVIGALAVWKFKVRKNARRLMEDMGDGDL